jgi:hypothetical protein
MKKPFAPDVLEDIFKFDSDNAMRLASRESSRLDFKESFNLGSADEYARTMAAFANTAGGYLVFGVKDSPRELLGLKSDNFDKTDPAKLTDILNGRFSPEIIWEQHTETVKGKKVGIIYTHEANRKPVVCTRNAKELQEAAIYYRYRGRTERIRFSELRELLDGELRRERELWMRNIQKMAKMGVENVALLDTSSGAVTGRSGSFLISEDLLSKIAFINSGTFVENAGTPTIRIIGDAAPIAPGLIQPTQQVRKPLHGDDILRAFVHQEKVLVPMDYISQVCFEASAFYPVFFFISQTSYTTAQVVMEVEKISSRRASKSKLLERLQTTRLFISGKLGGTTESGQKRKQMYESITGKTLDREDESIDRKIFLESLTHLPASSDKEYVLALLDGIAMSRYWSLTANELSLLRQAICHLDSVWYRLLVEGEEVSPARVAGKQEKK